MSKKKLKNKTKFQNIIQFLTAFSFIFLSTMSFAGNHNKLLVTSDSYERIENYFEKKFYSFVYNNELSDVTNLAFAISDDGQNTILGYCRENNILLCQTNSPYLFQTKKKCERKFKKVCKLIFQGNFLIKNNKKIEIENKEDLKLFINYTNKRIEPNRKNHSDFEIQSTKDTENCNTESC